MQGEVQADSEQNKCPRQISPKIKSGLAHWFPGTSKTRSKGSIFRMFAPAKLAGIEADASKIESLLDFFDTKYSDLSFESIRATLCHDFPDCDVSEGETLYFTYDPYPDFDFTISANPVVNQPPVVTLTGTWKFDGLVLTGVIGGNWHDRTDTNGPKVVTDAAKQVLKTLKKHQAVKTPHGS